MLPNSVKQHIAKLQQKKYRNEFGEFLIEGLKGVEEALSTDADVLMLVVEGTRRDEPEFATLIDMAIAKNVEVAYSGRKDIDTIKTTETYPGITAIVSQPVVDADDMMDGTPVLLLDGIRDPGNLGTIIRTADWFGIKHIILGPGSVDAYNDKVVRSTMGSIFRTHVVRIDTIEDTLGVFQKNGYHLASFDMEGTDYRDLPQSPKVVYVFGSESHGISPEVATLCTPYTIPQVGHAESLNVAMAAGIVMSFIS